MNHFQRAWRKLHGIEGDYANNPNDSGGETRWGVTAFVARKAGYTGPMRELPLELAEQIAKKEYWDRMRLDDVAAMSTPVANELFDTSYHVGFRRAATFLQRALNVLNQGRELFPDVAVDGAVGEVTLRAFNRYLSYRGAQGELVLLRTLNCLQGAFYVGLVESREKDEEFFYGWVRQRVVI